MMPVETKQDLKIAVLSQLGTGKAHAIPGKLLAQRLNQRDTRHIRLAIIELIEQGYPIIGDSAQGYFIAENHEEVKECLKRLKYGYGRMLYRHYKYLRIAGNKKFSGQLKLI